LFYKNKRSQSKKTHHLYIFSTSPFLFVPTKCSLLFLPLDCDLCKPQLQAGSIGTLFSKKTSRAHKKTGVPAFFNPNFFSVCFLFYKRKEKYNEKKLVRERRYPERKSPFFCISKYGGEMAFYMFLETPNLL